MPTLQNVVTFRDELLMRMPTWLRNGTAGRIVYAIGLHFDGFADAVAAGVRMRFPNHYSPESLPLIGRERRIRRGRSETDAGYGLRLRRWLDAHRYRGNPYELLRQLHAYFSDTPFVIELVYRSGRRFVKDAAGVVTRDDITWSPDAEPEKWARWWLFFHWPHAFAGDDGLWGDPGVWGDGGIWASGESVALIDELRQVPSDFNNAACFGFVVLMPPGTDVSGYPAADDWHPSTGSVGADRVEVMI